MLKAAEAAAILGIPEDQVLSLAWSGRLAHYQFGNAMRFEPADLQACIPHIKPLRPPRVLREAERLRLRIPESERPPSSLTAEELAIVQTRTRRQRQAPWANGKAIRAIYAEAKRLTATTGIPHHVDHEIPLQGEFVSGLHVETNLRVLPASENIKKSNRHQP